MKLFTLSLVSIISAGITFGIITAIFFTPTDITKLRIGERIEFQITIENGPNCIESIENLIKSDCE